MSIGGFYVTSLLTIRDKRVFIHLALAVFLIFTWADFCEAGSVTLGLSSANSSQISGFRIYYKTTSSGSPYDGTGIDQGPSPVDIPVASINSSQNGEIRLTGLQDGTDYFFAATVYDANGNESPLSNEERYTTPSNIPTFHTIVASITGTGAISPAGNTTVSNGASAAYSISTNDTFHYISDVKVDGQSIGAVSSYTFTNVTTDHTISASILPKTYTITANAGSGGVISPSGTQSALYGQSATYTVTPDPGYHLSGIIVDGNLVASGSSYVFSTINANHTITANFAVDTFTITANAGANGSITPEGTILVDNHSSVTFDIVPDFNYQVADVIVDGQSIGAHRSYVIDDVGADHTVKALFKVQQVSEPVFEYSELSIDHTWLRVGYKHQYLDPVVVAAPLNFNGGDPAVVRIRNVDSNGFEIRVQEWPYLDGQHVQESVGCLVMERGAYLLPDGTHIEAGSMNTGITNGARSVIFSQYFDLIPVVAASVVSYNQQDAVTGRLHHISNSGFDFWLQQQELDNVAYSNEAIHFIAWEPSTGVSSGVAYEIGSAANTVSDAFAPILFKANFSQPPVLVASMQTFNGGDTAGIRWQNKSQTAVEVKIEEEQSKDAETSHVYETLGYFLFAKQVLDSDGDGLEDTEEDIYGTDPQKADTDNDGIKDSDELTYWGQRWNEDPDGDGLINILDQDSDNDGMNDGNEVNQGRDPGLYDINPQNPRILTGQVTLSSEWMHVTLSAKLHNPVVLAGPLSHNGGDPAVVRIRNVSATGFDIRIQEWDYLDGQHIWETVGYVAMEQGQYQLGDGTRLEAGVFNSNSAQNFMSVKLAQTYRTVPVVMTSVCSVNEAKAVTGRIRNITQQEFSYQLQEQELNSRNHPSENIAYLAWEPSSGKVAGLDYQVVKTPNAVTHLYYNIMYPQPTGTDPVLLADMQTTNGGDTANIRFSGKDNFAVDALISEEQSLDSETKHVAETIGYLIISQ